VPPLLPLWLPLLWWLQEPEPGWGPLLQQRSGRHPPAEPLAQQLRLGLRALQGLQLQRQQLGGLQGVQQQLFQRKEEVMHLLPEEDQLGLPMPPEEQRQEEVQLQLLGLQRLVELLQQGALQELLHLLQQRLVQQGLRLVWHLGRWLLPLLQAVGENLLWMHLRSGAVKVPVPRYLVLDPPSLQLLRDGAEPPVSRHCSPRCSG